MRESFGERAFEAQKNRSTKPRTPAEIAIEIEGAVRTEHARARDDGAPVSFSRAFIEVMRGNRLPTLTAESVRDILRRRFGSELKPTHSPTSDAYREFQCTKNSTTPKRKTRSRKRPRGRSSGACAGSRTCRLPRFLKSRFRG